MNRDTAYVAYMKDAIRKIEAFTVGIQMEEFLSDEKTQSAVMLQLMLLGEMAKKISDSTCANGKCGNSTKSTSKSTQESSSDETTQSS